jgi:hypothetical protein
VPSNPAAIVFGNSSYYPSFSNFEALSSLAVMVNTTNSYATLDQNGWYIFVSIEPYCP